jgi:hypothetical protein
MACDTDGRFCGRSPAWWHRPRITRWPELPEPGRALGERGALGAWVVSGWLGCRRLTSVVCLEYARKLFAGQTFWLVTGSQSVVCKSIAKASKVRILHLPPRAPEGL